MVPMELLSLNQKDLNIVTQKLVKTLLSGARADIIVPNQPDFREQVLMFSDGLYTIGKDGSLPTPGEVDPTTGDL